MFQKLIKNNIDYDYVFLIKTFQDDITKSTHMSTMDRCKVIGRVQISVAKPNPDLINNEYMETSYTEVPIT